MKVEIESVFKTAQLCTFISKSENFPFSSCKWKITKRKFSEKNQTKDVLRQTIYVFPALPDFTMYLLKKKITTSGLPVITVSKMLPSPLNKKNIII